MDLTDAQWAVLEPLIPVVPRRDDGRGRPWREPRDVVNGVLWVLRTGAPWNDMPSRYPPSSTCHRRFQAWVKDGTLVKALRALAEDLKKRGKIDLEEAYVDGTHAGAKRGDPWWAEIAAETPPRSWQWRTVTAFLFLSPSLLASVMSPRSSASSSTRASSAKSRNVSSATGRTTRSASTKSSAPKASSSSRRKPAAKI
jgi:transposase